jgi:hypothetical protein
MFSAYYSVVVGFRATQFWNVQIVCKVKNKTCRPVVASQVVEATTAKMEKMCQFFHSQKTKLKQMPG